MVEKTNTVEQNDSPAKEYFSLFSHGDRLDYEIVGSKSDKPPILFFPGISAGTFVFQKLGESLSQKGSTAVFLPEQAKLREQDRTSGQDIIDREAHLYLRLLSEHNLQNSPVNVLAHSLGSLIFARAAELAKDLGWKCFEANAGASVLFVSPAGTYSNESLPRLSGRYVKFLFGSARSGKALDPTGEMRKSNTQIMLQDKPKFAREVLALARKKIDYHKLGDMGIKPFVFVYSRDKIFGHNVIGRDLKENDYLGGYATPVDLLESDVSFYKQSRNADHSDLQFNVDRNANAILQVFNQ